MLVININNNHSLINLQKNKKYIKTELEKYAQKTEKSNQHYFNQKHANSNAKPEENSNNMSNSLSVNNKQIYL